MVEQQLDAKSSSRPQTTKGHYLLEIAGIAIFAALAVLIGAEIFGGAVEFGYVWLLAILAVLAYLTSDFLSGFVHFLADNFGSYDTPVIGPGFIDAFREHHVDPKGITTHDFVDTNGNNSLVAIPFMLLVWLRRSHRNGSLGLPLRSVLPVPLCRHVPDQPVPQVGPHGELARHRGLAPEARPYPQR